VVVIGEEGIQALCQAPRVTALREAGRDVFLVDLRGWGETVGREHLLVTDSLLLGEPLLVQRVRDALAVAAYLRTRNDVSGRIALLGQGVSAGLTALVAGALDDGFDAVAAPDLPASLLDLYDAGVPADAAVWELLKVTDLPHLKALCGERMGDGK
jgi:hypothetical protein